MDHALAGNRDAVLVTPDGVALDAIDEVVTGPLHQLRSLVALLRPTHWIKGSLVLAVPLVTAPVTALTHLPALALTLLAFLAASSTVYVLNDLLDRHNDRLHPVKRLRPLASGRVAPSAARKLLAVLLLGTVGLLVAAPPLAALVIGGYLLMNAWYSAALKHQSLVDVSVVAAGFVLRALAGVFAVGLGADPLLLICVYCACVALSLGKRRHELAGLAADGQAGPGHRPVLSAYSVPFLDHVVVVHLVAALACYVAWIWQVSPPYGALGAGLTFPFAAFTVTRYLQLLMVERSGGNPVEDLVRDRRLRVNVGLWGAALLPIFIAGAL
ncbi:MAG TPA: UbiA prenyltransferase family protein [Pilimelia sp.]|nr:UbiA prenyltransferase family protein [Pilimelia sp.]